MYEDKFSDMNEKIIPVKMPLDILYEDDSLILCNKPLLLSLRILRMDMAQILWPTVLRIISEKRIFLLFSGR